VRVNLWTCEVEPEGVRVNLWTCGLVNVIRREVALFVRICKKRLNGIRS